MEFIVVQYENETYGLIPEDDKKKEFIIAMHGAKRNMNYKIKDEITIPNDKLILREIRDQFKSWLKSREVIFKKPNLAAFRLNVDRWAIKNN